MTQIETLTAQLAQAQAEIERLKTEGVRIFEAFDKAISKSGNSRFTWEHVRQEISFYQALFENIEPLPDGIGKAMADVVRAAVVNYKARKESEIDCTCELCEAVQTYQKMMEGV